MLDDMFSNTPTSSSFSATTMSAVSMCNVSHLYCISFLRCDQLCNGSILPVQYTSKYTRAREVFVKTMVSSPRISTTSISFNLLFGVT